MSSSQIRRRLCQGGNHGRRDFLHVLGLTAAAMALPKSLLAGVRADRIERIGVQLYTVRDEMKRDFDGTLARIAELGYREVEFPEWFGRSAAQVREALRRTGLAAPAAHVPLEATAGDRWKRTLDDARTIGHRYLVVAWLHEDDRKDLDAYRRVAERLDQAGETARRAGCGFAYHNHDFEFAPMGGRIPYDVLVETTNPEHVRLELDLYWITKGGQDPLEYFDRWPGRFPLVHVKDSAGPPEHRMADVGGGTIDWAKIFARRERAGIEHFFVERDDPPDPLASVAASYAYLRDLRF